MNDISPVRVGQTDPSCHWTFKDSLGDPYPLPANTVFTQYIYNVGTGFTATGQGTFTNFVPANGTVDYNWSAADSAAPGQYQVFAGYVTPGGAQGYTDPVDWTVNPITVQQ